MSFIPLVCVLFPSVCSVSLYSPVFRFLVASLVRPAKVHMALSSSPSDGLLGGVAEEVHVLAVDDSIVDRKLIEKLLKNFHFKVTTAENALRALEYLGIGDKKDGGESKEIKINMIITDYCMPGMTGYELLKKIKESSTVKEIPVVIMSSENIPTRINKCLEEGAQEFMLKPIQQSDVNKLRCQMSKLSKSCSGRICLGR